MSIDLPPHVGAAPPVVSSARLSAAVHNGERLQALTAEGLLAGGAPEPIFDRFARLAARLADTPTALVSVVTDEQQYFAGLCGIPQPWADARQTPLSHSFCQHVVANRAPLVIEDARADPVLCSNLAVRDLDVIAYAGFPIFAPTGTCSAACARSTRRRASGRSITSKRWPTSPRSSAASSSGASSYGVWRSKRAPTRSPGWPTAVPGTPSCRARCAARSASATRSASC